MLKPQQQHQHTTSSSIITNKNNSHLHTRLGKFVAYKTYGVCNVLIINFLTKAHQANNGRFIWGDVFFLSFSRVHCLSMLMLPWTAAAAARLAARGEKWEYFAFYFRFQNALDTHASTSYIYTYPYLISISTSIEYESNPYIYDINGVFYLCWLYFENDIHSHSTQQRYAYIHIHSCPIHTQSRVLTTHSVMQNHLKSDLASDVAHTHTHKLSERMKNTQMFECAIVLVVYRRPTTRHGHIYLCMVIDHKDK